MAKDVMFL